MNRADIDYQNLLTVILEEGTDKAPARAGMPGTRAWFGYQMRFDLQEGFPALTTKKLYFKGVVAELLWFLRGDTNIKYLDENKAYFWHEDAYNYYVALCRKLSFAEHEILEFDDFVGAVQNDWDTPQDLREADYKWGDCGYQYGKVWRNWDTVSISWASPNGDIDGHKGQIDQIDRVLKNLKKNPEGRRHVVTAVDPAHDNELALYWCHALFQFNCRPLTLEQRKKFFEEMPRDHKSSWGQWDNTEEDIQRMNDNYVPHYYLDCQLYQRSGDVFLGVPFNIASYALLVHMFSRMLNMVPGHFVHTFGDVHLYNNHFDQAQEQLLRTPKELPQVRFAPHVKEAFAQYLVGNATLDQVIATMDVDSAKLINYDPHPAIKAELSTGRRKK